MIYSINKSITLYGEAADDFLDSVGVELYEEHVVIGENVYIGADGEAILNENGVYLYKDHIVLEGQQAEEHLKKQMDDYNKNNEEDERDIAKYNYGRRDLNSRSPKTVNRDPKFKTARELEAHRKTYGRIMPGLSKSERKYADAKNAELKIARQAHDMVVNKMADDNFNKSHLYYQRAEDATRRYLRKQMKKTKHESTIFKSVDLI